MATATTIKPESESKTESKGVPLTGERAVIWIPDLDPTSEKLPSLAVASRPFVFGYVDQTKTKITQATPSGGLVPQFETFILREPGVNWVKCAALEKAIAASKKMATPPEELADIEDLKARFFASMHIGEDPIATQLNAKSIIIPDLFVDSPTGTVNDYSLEGIRAIAEATKEVDQLQFWLRAIQTAIVQHPEKVAVERYLTRLIDTRNGIR